MEQQQQLLSDQTLSLLSHLWRGGQWGYFWVMSQEGNWRHTHWIETTSIPSSLDEVKLKREREGLFHYYFGVHPVNARPERMKNGRARAYHSVRAGIEDIAAINCLFAELDYKDYGIDESLLEHIKNLGPLPTTVVFSGGGYHCYWLLKDTFVIASDEDRERIRSIQEQWVQYIGGDKGAKDIARVLRLPGTQNVKKTHAPHYPIVRFTDIGCGELYDLATLAEKSAIVVVSSMTRQDDIDQSSPSPTSGEQSRIEAYCKRVLEDECRNVATAALGTKHHTRLAAAAKVGGFLHYGVYTYSEAFDALMSAALSNTDDPTKAQKAIQYGLDNCETRYVPEAEELRKKTVREQNDELVILSREDIYYDLANTVLGVLNGSIEHPPAEMPGHGIYTKHWQSLYAAWKDGGVDGLEREWGTLVNDPDPFNNFLRMVWYKVTDQPDKAEEMETLIEEERKSLATDPNDARPVIDVTNMDLLPIMSQAWDALMDKHKAPFGKLYMHDNLFVRLGQRADERNSFVHTIPVDNNWIHSELYHAARFVVYGKKTTRLVEPPAGVIRSMTTLQPPNVPKLHRIIYAPAFDRNGMLTQQPGYNSRTKVYYDARPHLKIPDVPEEPSYEQMVASRNFILQDMLFDFPFAKPADRANAVALLILPYVRDMIDGPTPFHLVNSPVQGSGKGTLIDVLLGPALGRFVSPMTAPTTEEEWGKKLTAKLATAPTVINIDNIKQTLKSPTLAAILTTSDYYEDRLLGSSTNMSIKIRQIFVGSGNNVSLDTDIARRTIFINLTPNTSKPWKRGNFKHNNIKLWMLDNAGEIIYHTLVMIKYGLKHGKSSHTFGSCDQWAEVVGRILNGCGIYAFLENEEENDIANLEHEGWSILFAEWWKTYGKMPIKTAEVLKLIEDYEIPIIIRGDTPSGRAVSLGMMIGKYRNRVVDFLVEESEFESDPLVSMSCKVVSAGKKSKSQTWSLIPQEEVRPDGDPLMGAIIRQNGHFLVQAPGLNIKVSTIEEAEVVLEEWQRGG